MELHGALIPSGSRVMLVWGSANHDERELDGSPRRITSIWARAFGEIPLRFG